MLIIEYAIVTGIIIIFEYVNILTGYTIADIDINSRVFNSYMSQCNHVIITDVHIVFNGSSLSSG